MIRSYTLPTLAAGVIVASSGVINSSEVAAQGKAGVALPTCAGAGTLAFSQSAAGPGFNDPNACLLEELANMAVEAAHLVYDANVQLVAATQDLYYAAEYVAEQSIC